MESQNQITALDTTVSEQAAVAEETITSSDILPVEENKSKVAKGKRGIESASTFVSYVSVNQEGFDTASAESNSASFHIKPHVSSSESSNIATGEENLASVTAELRNVSLEKKELEIAKLGSSNISDRKKTFTLSPKEVLPEVEEMAFSSDSFSYSFTVADKFGADKKENPIHNIVGTTSSVGQVESRKPEEKISYDSTSSAVFYKSRVGTADKSGRAYESSTSILQAPLDIAPNVSPFKNLEDTDLNVKTLRNLASRRISFVTDISRPPPDFTEEIDLSNSYENLPSSSGSLHQSAIDPVEPKDSADNEDNQVEAVNNTAPSGTKSEPGEMDEDNERKAFFYISSSSIPGMGTDWDWPSVSSGYYYQRPTRRPDRRITRQYTPEDRRCLGTQRCHYVILAIAILGAISGCVTYHLQDYGIGPKVLRPIGASTAFLSFVVCTFSSIYLTYLCYYPHGRSGDYQVLGAASSDEALQRNTQSAGRYDERGNYVSTSRSGNAQQFNRETQSADVLDKRGYNYQQTEVKRSFDHPSTSGYDPNSKRIRTDPAASEVYEMRSVHKERSESQASDTSSYTLAEQPHGSSCSGENVNTEKIPLLPKK